MNTHEQESLAFFERHYRSLRSPYKPMRWMRRLFLRLVSADPPSLIDLPTGTGKTDLIVVWLIALGWFGLSRTARSAVPRRLVWVVNRRVLVQQAYELSEKLSMKFAAPESSAPNEDVNVTELRQALAKLCRENTENVFRVVQLRGQLVDDREWSLDPTIPQLIIGTVDQIGSRLLFQGYGLGKWSRPLHAAILGVDAWICLDEAHLVPAFAMTLRQVTEIIHKPLLGEIASTPLGHLFSSLPFWLTELSATPALVRPPDVQVLSKIEEDAKDAIVEDRLLAADTRRAVVHFCKEDEVSNIIATKAQEAIGKVGTVAIFCQKVKTAAAVSKALRKDPRIGEKHVLLVTGRLRGYERDRLRDREAFKAFRRPEATPVQSGEGQETYYLVGTAAAEVGLDADADMILCDFAPIPTLIQRLGRLDRRGVLSRRAVNSQGEIPTMTIFAAGSPPVGEDENLKALASALSSPQSPAEIFAAFPWRQATQAGKDAAGEKTTGNPPETFIEGATWKILLPAETAAETAHATKPSTWLAHDLARITVGPVVVPPLTDHVIQQWAATTIKPSRFLPVHPWLYGLLPDDGGMPLVGVAFRIEMDLLQNMPPTPDDEEEEEDVHSIDHLVCRAFKHFPPLRAELHFVPLPRVREWVASNVANGLRIAHFDGDEWSLASADVALHPDDVLVLATSIDQGTVKELLEGDIEDASCDVLDGMRGISPKYRREIDFASPGTKWTLVKKDGAQRFTRTSDLKKRPIQEESPAAGDDKGWCLARSVTIQGRLGGTPATIRYFSRKRREQHAQLLSQHQITASAAGRALAAAIGLDNAFLDSLLSEAGFHHDEGKKYPPWQRAMGNDDLATPIAKSKPEVERPASIHGYRHEWGSLLVAAEDCPTTTPKNWPPNTQIIWRDLWQHLIGAHHGYLRTSLPNQAFRKDRPSSKQGRLRLEAVERSAHLQFLLGPWRLAYLESLLKTIDVEASRNDFEDSMEDPDEQ